MGMYNSVRMRLTIKPKFRSEFDRIALLGRWDMMSDPILQEYDGYHVRAAFIGRGALSYAPSEWEDQNGAPTDGFDTSWNEETGEWIAQFSVKVGSDDIEDFMNLIPYLCESVEHFELYYETWRDSELWELHGHHFYCVNRHYRTYDPEGETRD